MNVKIVVKDEDGEPVGDCKIFVNDEMVSKNSPASTSVSAAVWNNHILRVTADGYLSVDKEFRREVKVGMVILGFFVWIPFLWCYGPKPIQVVTLQKKK